MHIYFAHAGEVHEIATTPSAVSSSPLDTWYVAALLFVMLSTLIAAVTYAISKSKVTTYNVLLAAMFIIGVALYSTSSVVGAVALTVGFAMALFQVMIGLGAPHDNENTKQK